MGTYTFKIVAKGIQPSGRPPGFWLYLNKREIPDIVMRTPGADTWTTSITAEPGQTVGVVLDAKVADDGSVVISVKPPSGPTYYPAKEAPLLPDENGRVSVAFGHRLR